MEVYCSKARRFFFVGRCVRLGENPISEVARKQICETRTVSEREYKVTVSHKELTRTSAPSLSLVQYWTIMRLFELTIYI